jgi:hypothetical protein
MSSGTRIGVLVGTVVVLVLAFVLLSPGGDEDESTATTPTVTVAATPPGEPQKTTTAVRPPPAPAFETIRVRAGKPVGGVRTITVSKGDRARIQVTSPDTSDEIHLHVYDIARDLKAGSRVRFSFQADLEGIFEIELEGSGVKIGRLVVEP